MDDRQILQNGLLLEEAVIQVWWTSVCFSRGIGA